MSSEEFAGYLFAFLACLFWYFWRGEKELREHWEGAYLDEARRHDQDTG